MLDKSPAELGQTEPVASLSDAALLQALVFAKRVLDKGAVPHGEAWVARAQDCRREALARMAPKIAARLTYDAVAPLRALVEAFGGNPPDWLQAEYDAAAEVLARIEHAAMRAIAPAAPVLDAGYCELCQRINGLPECVCPEDED